MLVRLKYNLGSCRLTCDINWTLKQLKDLVTQTLRVEGSIIQLSADLDGLRLFNSDESLLANLGFKHGIEVFLVGRFEKIILEKSYVDLDGVIVSAGSTLKRVDKTEQVPVDDAQKVETRSAPKNVQTTEVSENDILSALSINKRELSRPNSTTTSSNTFAPTKNDNRSTEHLTQTTTDSLNDECFQHQLPLSEVNPFEYDFDEEEDRLNSLVDKVRAPDPTERMTLLDHHSSRDEVPSQHLVNLTL